MCLLVQNGVCCGLQHIYVVGESHVSNSEGAKSTPESIHCLESLFLNSIFRLQFGLVELRETSFIHRRGSFPVWFPEPYYKAFLCVCLYFFQWI